MQQKGLHRISIIDITVAIVIVAILSSVLFPVFEDARSKAQDEACMSNLRQIGLGFAQYTQDYDERMPIARHWGWELYPYLKTAALYQCPKDSNKSTDIIKPLSYAMNKNLDHLNLTMLKAPALSVLGAEYDSTNVFVTLKVNPSRYSATSGLESNKIATWGSINRLGRPAVSPTRHDPNLVFLEADGHVKMMRPDQVIGGANAIKQNLPPNATRAAGTGALSSNWALTFSAI
jgi:type II secretory pathway pseudopilin PulG